MREKKPLDLSVVQHPRAAAALLDPTRALILKALRQPGSAASVARSLGLPRQRVAYHVRQLEKAGLVTHEGDNRRGNCVERLVKATATHYLVGPASVGELGPAGGEYSDQFSSSYLLGTAASLINELTTVREQAAKSKKRVPTLTLNSTVEVESSTQMAQFAEDLTKAVAEVVAKYQSTGDHRRSFRLVVGSYPKPDHQKQ